MSAFDWPFAFRGRRTAEGAMYQQIQNARASRTYPPVGQVPEEKFQFRHRKIFSILGKVPMTSMELSKKYSQFCEWHDGFKQGNLANETVEPYMQARRDICGVLLVGQRLAIESSSVTRGSLRVARAYPIDFGFPSGVVTSVTHDISTSGLSALVSEAPPVGSVITMRLKVGDGATIIGRCQVVKIIPMQGIILMGVAFEGLPAEAREEIETAVCDVVVTELRSALQPRQIVLSQNRGGIDSCFATSSSFAKMLPVNKVATRRLG
jgi:hypothetical protein